MCCGQKRDAMKSGVADSAEVKLYYVGAPGVQMRGNATGRLYLFSRSFPLQLVERRDAVPMLQTQMFRLTK
jgi:hypothetical protein